ncbi:outer membrane protein assembly factor BamE [Pseudomonas sp. Y24-6]|uniref:outer membrane protein assembly factor BamE domain-containing protein n=1 Tax=Pseudomonas sp. Y24-6 TaxID=2750013 RepID=UPI001CE1DE63|nr:outer membrane protein assembly factor BamE [Pseudomonas sp. Y24-6]MCA4960996.1 outer membrane protein assembly factor BamE [Pseudomonas sp. Y24-6]
MLRFIAICLTALMLGGCASSGQKITPDRISQIEVGKTTVEQMSDLFGSPTSQSYGTEGKLAMNWVYVFVGPFGMGMKQQSLAVLFNEDNKVEKYNVLDAAPGGVRFGP